MNISSERLQLFRNEIRTYKSSKEIKNFLLEGWPHDKRKIPDDLKVYWKHRNDLTIENDIIFFNDRVIVPHSLRKNVLAQLHSSHLGIEKTKKRACSLVYCPKIDESIENMITHCDVCQKYRASNSKEPMLSHLVPKLPFSKLGIDICEYANKSYLVLSYYYSRFLDIIPLNTKTASECINKLKVCFSIHDIPLNIVSDNMPFNSLQFKMFCKKHDINLITTNPGHSQANGFAEKAVGIAKNLIKKTLESKQEIWLALLEFRNTPLKEVDASPAELLMSRKTRTLLPCKINQFQPHFILNIVQNKNTYVKMHYDKNAKAKLPFKKGDNIWCNHGLNTWINPTIEKIHPSPRSYRIRLEDGTVLRRNSKWIRKRFL